jgi:hypothetical protein
VNPFYRVQDLTWSCHQRKQEYLVNKWFYKKKPRNFACSTRVDV